MKRFFTVRNERSHEILGNSVELAATLWERCRGLLGRKSLSLGAGLILSPCQSIHTFGMRFPIDVIFVDQESRVIASISQMKPGRLSAWHRKSKWVLELPAGTLSEKDVQLGDLLIVTEITE